MDARNHINPFHVQSLLHENAKKLSLGEFHNVLNFSFKQIQALTWIIHSGICRILWTDSSSCLNPLCCWICQSRLKHLKHCVLNFFKTLTWIKCIVCSSEMHWQTHFHEDFCCLESIALPQYYNTAYGRRDSIDSLMFSNFLLGFSSKHKEDHPFWDVVYDEFLLQPKRCLPCPVEMGFSLSRSVCLKMQSCTLMFIVTWSCRSCEWKLMWQMKLVGIESRGKPPHWRIEWV